jgi:hypothetical protein
LEWFEKDDIRLSTYEVGRELDRRGVGVEVINGGRFGELVVAPLKGGDIAGGEAVMVAIVAEQNHPWDRSPTPTPQNIDFEKEDSFRGWNARLRGTRPSAGG